MGGSTTTVLDTLLLIELIVTGVCGGNNQSVPVNTYACDKTGAYHSASQGTIISPLNNTSHPTHVSCHWILNNPWQDTLILSFSKFDLDQDSKCNSNWDSCCSHQWLLIKEDQTKGDEEEISEESNSGISEVNTDHENHALFPSDFASLLAPFTPSKEFFRRNTETRTVNTSVTTEQRDIKTTGNTRHMCGRTRPPPMQTRAKKVIIKFFSDTHANITRERFRLNYYRSRGGACREGSVKCGDSSVCIPKSWRCNSQRECPDGSDEEGCPKVTCESMTGTQRCDGTWNCHQGEDEKGCSGCRNDEWWCGNVGGGCFRQKERCDGIHHCQSGVDEIACYNECGSGMLRCGNECYTFAKRCDGSADCSDESDEAACPPHLCHSKFGRFLCSNGQCIRSDWRCDRETDCVDGSDEEGCLRNTVVGVWAMGGLVCCLLLVLALGCSGRLYALRTGLSRGHPSPALPVASITVLERHLQQRELPPPYPTALTHPAHVVCGSGVMNPAVPPALGAVMSSVPPLHPGRGSGGGGGAELSGVGNVGRRGEEKEGEERVKVNEFFSPAPFHSQNGEDVPLLLGMSHGTDATDDVPFLLAESSDHSHDAEDLTSATDEEESEDLVKRDEDESSSKDKFCEEITVERRESIKSEECSFEERSCDVPENYKEETSKETECDEMRGEEDKGHSEREATRSQCSPSPRRETHQVIPTSVAMVQHTQDTTAHLTSHPLVVVVNECNDDSDGDDASISSLNPNSAVC